MNKKLQRKFIGWVMWGAMLFWGSSLEAQGLKLVSLEGDLVQGGVLIGKVTPGTGVHCFGRDLRVSEDGFFVLGFDRDAALKTSIRLKTDEGEMADVPISLRKRDYSIESIDGLPAKKVTPDRSHFIRIQIEADMIKKVREINLHHTDFMDDFIWPVKGRITGRYGSQRVLNGIPRTPHYGIDIAAPEGMPVVAPSGGIVTFVHADMYYSGGTLVLDHGHGLSSTFLHLKRVLVKEGVRVEKGTAIAEVGKSGRVTGAHLDWRINWFEHRVDPEGMVPSMDSESTSCLKQQK